MMIDTHAHLDMPEFAADLPAVLDRARHAGVAQIVSVSIGLVSLRRNLELAATYPFIATTAGVHPHDAATVSEAAWEELVRLAADPRVVGIGETGLDYHRERSPRDRQLDLFLRHIDLARRVRKPLVIHSRDAFADVLRLLEQENAGLIGGVMHCFSGTPAEARRVKELDFMISIAGPLTYPRSHLPEVVRGVRVEQLLIETDAPYLAPQPYRGRRNEPAYLAATAAALASHTGLSPNDVRRITTRNACALFRLSGPPPADGIAYPIRNSLYLNVTNRCNNHCVFCARETNPVVKGHDLRLEREPTAAEILAAAGDVSCYSEIVFCGYGEPLLRWDVVQEVARTLKARGARIRINTNGQSRLFLGHDILPEMTGLVDVLSVSLNAPEAAAYAKICRPETGAAAYDAVKEFIHAAQRSVPEVIASAVSFPGVDLEACRRVATQELGVRFRVRPWNEIG